MSIKIKNISYNNTKDIRLLEAVLTNWFNNPKELNLIDPRMSYPFNFKKWIEITYKESNIQSYCWKDDKWIVGIGNIKFNQKSQKDVIWSTPRVGNWCKRISGAFCSCFRTRKRI